MTVVLDASVIAEYLVGSRVGRHGSDRMREHAGDLHVPQLAVVETASVFRSWVRRGEVSDRRASAALVDLAELPARRWPEEPLLPRMWEMRENLTVYDATYVALAELLDADLLTADRRLARGIAGVSDVCVLAVTAGAGDS